MNKTPSTSPRETLPQRLAIAIAQRNALQANEIVQAIYRTGLKLSDFAYPAGLSPLHLAIAASAFEAMVDVWAHPTHNRLESAPQWCASVPPLEEPFSVIPQKMSGLFSGELMHPAFASRNIQAPAQYLDFI